MELLFALAVFIVGSFIISIGKMLSKTDAQRTEWDEIEHYFHYGSSGSPGCALAVWFIIVFIFGVVLVLALEII